MTNLTARFAQLLINGVDYSPYFFERKVSEELVDVATGLVRVTGQLVLRYNWANRSTLNPEQNPNLFAAGVPVIMRVRNSAGSIVAHPRGLLWIDNAYPDRLSTVISLVCLLTRHNGENPATDATGARADGTPITPTTAVNNLLIAAGVPGGLSGSLPGGNYAYLMPNTGGSYIEQAGAIAASNGYYLHQTPGEAGTVEARAINLAPASALFSRTVGTNEIGYEPLARVESVPSAVIVTGVASWRTANPLNTSNTTTEATGVKTETVTWVGNVQTIVTTDSTDSAIAPLYKLADANAKVEVTTTNTYEPDTGSLGVDPNNQGRLLRTVSNRRFPVGAAISTSLTAVSYSIYWANTQEIVEYEYFDSPVDQIGLKQRITTTQGTTYEGSSPFVLQPAQRAVRTWELTAIPDYWEYKQELFTNIDNFLYTNNALSGSFTSTQGKTVVSRGNNGQNLPPAPQRRPDPNPVSTRPFSVRIPVIPPAGTYPTKPRTYQLVYPPSAANRLDGTPEQYADLFGRRAAGLLVARSRPREITVELTDALLTGYFPLCRADYTDGDTIRTHLLNAAQWTDTETRSEVVFEGMTTGATVSGVPSPPPATLACDCRDGFVIGDWIVETKPIVFWNGFQIGDWVQVTLPTAARVENFVNGFVVGDWVQVTMPTAAATSNILVLRHSGSYNTWTTISNAAANVIPYDNTTPTNTEGVQVLSQSVAATDVSSVIVVNAIVHVYSPNSGLVVTAALFAGSECIGVSFGAVLANTLLVSLPVKSRPYSPGSTSSITYSLRVGPGAANTIYLNGSNTNGLYNGEMTCTLEILEKLP